MIRYMSIDCSDDRNFDTVIAYEIESPVFILDKKPLKVPYIKLDIRIVGKEERFIENRKSVPRKSVIRTCGDILKRYLGGRSVTEKEAYKRGMMRGIWQYAVWRNGGQYVGDGTRTLQEADLKVDEAVVNYWPEDSIENMEAKNGN